MSLSEWRILVAAIRELVTLGAVLALAAWAIYAGRDVLAAGAVVAIALLERRPDKDKGEEK